MCWPQNGRSGMYFVTNRKNNIEPRNCSSQVASCQLLPSPQSVRLFILISDPTQVPTAKVVSVVTALERPDQLFFFLSFLLTFLHILSHFFLCFFYPILFFFYLDGSSGWWCAPTNFSFGLSHVYYLVCPATTFGIYLSWNWCWRC